MNNKEIGDAPNIFNTDDAKLLSPDYNPQGKGEDEIAKKIADELREQQRLDRLAEEAEARRLKLLGIQAENQERKKSSSGRTLIPTKKALG